MRTVREWFEAWPRLAPGLRPRSADTIARTRRLAGSFERRFGRRVLADLPRAECVAWAAQHPSHVRYARTILADAVLAGVLDESPLRGVGFAATHGAGEDYVPDADEVALLADELGEGLGDFALVAAYSGMRLSEVAALERRDVVVGPQGQGTLLCHVRAGKGGRARHVILFPPGAQALMWQAPDVGRVFSRPEGGAWCRKSVNRRWVTARRRVGLPTVRFHALRKFHATMLLDRGVSDLDVAVQLGHFTAAGRPNAELVRQVYGRPDPMAALARVAGAA